MINKTLIIYGGNSKIIQSCMDFFIINFKTIIVISRIYSGKKHRKIKIIDYDKLKIEEGLRKYLDNNFVFISAAVYSSNKLFVDEDTASIKNSFNINILNNIKIMQYLIKSGVNLKDGKFIYLSSFRVNFPTVGTSLYSSTKTYVEKLFESMAIEYSRFNLKFNVIKIGLTEYGLSNKLSFDLKSKRFQKNNIASLRLLNSDDLKSTFTFLFENNYVNGSSIDLTGKIKLDLKA
jgi:short-subunit dehydrogenase